MHVRHAQGVHNVAGEKNHDAYNSYEFFDAHLTSLGWEQVIASQIYLNAMYFWMDFMLREITPQSDHNYHDKYFKFQTFCRDWYRYSALVFNNLISHQRNQ